MSELRARVEEMRALGVTSATWPDGFSITVGDVIIADESTQHEPTAHAAEPAPSRDIALAAGGGLTPRAEQAPKR